MAKEKINKKRLWVLLSLAGIVLAALLIMFLLPGISGSPKIKDGVLNLDGHRGEAMSLEGEWGFYWERFLTQEEAAEKAPDITMAVPSAWDNYKLDGKNLSSFGYGTYTLKVENARPGEALALRVPGFATSYNLYVDGKLLIESGKVGSDKEHSSPESRPYVAEFAPEGESFIIVIHAANFSCEDGGMLYKISMGTPGQIRAMDKNISNRNAFMLGAIAVAVFYYLGNFLLRRRAKNYLFLALMWGLWAARIAVSGDMLIYRLIPSIGFSAMLAIYHISMCWLAMCAILLTNSLFPQKGKTIISKIFFVFYAVVSVFIIVVPLFPITNVILASAIPMGIYCIWVLSASLLEGKKDALIVLLCFLAMIICLVYDVVFLASISELGYFIVMCLTYFVVTKWSKESDQSVDTLSQSLKISDDKATAAEAAFMQAQIKPHFLFNTLNAIASFCDTDPPRAQKLIGDFSDYLRNSIDMKSPETFVPIERELGFVRSYTDIEEARFGSKLKIEYDIDTSVKARVPMLSIQPLVENAINHGLRKKGGGGTVTVTVKKEPEGVFVSVDDDGQGMPPEKVASLLLPGANQGIGLWNIDMRLKKLFGKGLTIESTPREGTRVVFIVPPFEGGKYD